MPLKLRILGAVLLVATLPSGMLAQSSAEVPCSIKPAVRTLGRDTNTLWRGIRNAPRNALLPHNLAWELPIAATTGLLISKADVPAADGIQSQSLQNAAGLWSNIGLGMEIGAGVLTWTGGCAAHRGKVAEVGFTAMAALGAAGLVDLGLKAAFNREYPYGRYSTGRFWHGGKSFPSGHSATSFAFASVVAHRYPNKRWVKWGAYAVAAGVSLSRWPAKKHFPSDILMGATLGYVTGTYIADHTMR